MDTKLTLKLDKEKIEQAKQYAKSKNQSLSSLVEKYFSFLSSSEPVDMDSISPNIKELIGIIDSVKEENLDDLRDRYLLEKYLDE